MMDFKAAYFALQGRIADAIELLQNAQQEGEAAYAEAEDR